MRKRAFLLCKVLLAAPIITGCTSTVVTQPTESAVDAAPLRVVNHDSPGFSGPEPARTGARLGAEADGCVYIEFDGDRYTPIWPAGITATGTHDAFSIVDADGETIRESGVEFVAGGLIVPQPTSEELSNTDCITGEPFLFTNP